MLHPVELEGLVAIMFSLAIPIFAIVMGVSKSIKKNENERKIRELLITNHTDPQMAKLLAARSGKTTQQRSSTKREGRPCANTHKRVLKQK